MKFDISDGEIVYPGFPQIRLGHLSGKPYIFRSNTSEGIGMFPRLDRESGPLAAFEDTKLAPVGYSVTLTQE